MTGPLDEDIPHKGYFMLLNLMGKKSVAATWSYLKYFIMFV